MPPDQGCQKEAAILQPGAATGAAQVALVAQAALVAQVAQAAGAALSGDIGGPGDISRILDNTL